jgi:hypothetical protein
LSDCDIVGIIVGIIDRIIDRIIVKYLLLAAAVTIFSPIIDDK